MEDRLKSLIKRYNIAAPRYTSYPTVPYWDTEKWMENAWIGELQTVRDDQKGLSIYIHLPFCESLCTYCGCNTRITKNHQVELPYIEAVLREWRKYLGYFKTKPLLTDLHLGGGTPTFFDAENLAFLISEILKEVDVTNDAAFSFEAHPANTSIKHLELLYDLGFKRISLGIQDFNTSVQQIINRKQSPADVIGVMQAARKIGYTSINFDLIYGLPLQTCSSIKETIQIALGMKPERIAFYSYAHVPWMKPGQRMFTEADLPSDEEKLSFYQEGKKMIKEAGYKEIGMDHFAFPTDNLAFAIETGRLHRNFMGYTDRKPSLLLGLGVSSISDTGTAFAQNVKTVEQYIKMIADDRLPLLKGHFLTEEDLQIRKQILALMCTGSLSLVEFPLSTKTKERLKPFIADCMVILDKGQLKVTELGKFFLRNICMAFDERYLLNKQDKELFSKAI